MWKEAVMALFEFLLFLIGEAEGSPKISWSGYPVSGIIYEPRTSWIYSTHVNHSNTTFDANDTDLGYLMNAEPLGNMHFWNNGLVIKPGNIRCKD